MEEENYSILSDKQIIQQMKKEHLLIYPYQEKNLNNTSYDVTLGPNYFSASSTEKILIPWNDLSVHNYWGQPRYASKIQDTDTAKKFCLPIGAEYILLQPGEKILAHTNEFIGGLKFICTSLHARSSLTRLGLEISGNGWGSVGYFNRWTMHITNNTNAQIPLVVGSRIAQVVFYFTNLVSENYTDTGSYQSKYSGDKYENNDKLFDRWSPGDMIPRYKL